MELIRCPEHLLPLRLIYPARYCKIDVFGTICHFDVVNWHSSITINTCASRLSYSGIDRTHLRWPVMSRNEQTTIHWWGRGWRGVESYSHLAHHFKGHQPPVQCRLRCLVSATQKSDSPILVSLTINVTCTCRLHGASWHHHGTGNLSLSVQSNIKYFTTTVPTTFWQVKNQRLLGV